MQPPSKPRQGTAGKFPPAAVGHAAQHVQAQADRRPDGCRRDRDDQESEQHYDRFEVVAGSTSAKERAISETPQPRKAAQAEIMAL